MVEYEGGVHEEIQELLDRARSLGAQSIESSGLEWHQTPLGPAFQATACIITADGLTVRRDGWARPGDAQVQAVSPADEDWFVEARAEKRALARAIRTAYPQVEQSGQPPWQKELQKLLREVAEARGIERDQQAAEVAGLFGLQSTASLSAQQCDAAVAHLRALLDAYRSETARA